MRGTAPALLLALALVPFAAACDTARSGSFDAQSATPSPTCLQHQTGTPDRRYTGGVNADPTAVLDLMRFYTANGTKAYCDGKPPTDADRRWTTLYTTLGGDPAHVGGHP